MRSICGGCAAIVSWEDVFQFSIYTLVAASIGFALFVAFWKLLFLEHKDKRAKILLAVVILILIAGGLAGVIYPLKFVASHEFPNLVKGLIAAMLALLGGAFLLFRCKRFFDADERKNSPSKLAGEN